MEEVNNSGHCGVRGGGCEDSIVRVRDRNRTSVGLGFLGRRKRRAELKPSGGVEPERRSGVDLEVDDKFSANVLRVELVETSVKSTIVRAWLIESRLRDRVVQL